MRRTVHALPALSVPVVVLGGLYGGLVTITESAALSAITVLLMVVTVWLGRSLVYRHGVGVSSHD